HFHTDHPVFSCSKIEQKQLNTWVSFQSAEQPLLGQFSVSGNSFGGRPRWDQGWAIGERGSRDLVCGHGASMRPPSY
ncbi:hypothetical protein, partial [Pseudomonas aeruginosa]|uniref:hypothetical protein n=1 Tax=Pseudomonas aeruginosa TaxID=287 RepID=UPI001266217A